MPDNVLLYNTEENAAYFTINREKQRNSINFETISLFLEYLDQAEQDADVRVIHITGAGTKAFCTGADLGNTTGRDALDAYARYAQLLKRISSFPKPTVAKVRGYCLAGGMGVMLASDIVIAENDAKFGTPEVNVGLFPMMIGALIFRNVLRKSAMEMVLSGRILSADEALKMGMITRTVQKDELDSDVDSTLKLLTSKSPIGMKIGKEAFYAMADMPFDEAVDYLSAKLGEIAATEDAKEGIKAFIEKRKPEFKGR